MKTMKATFLTLAIVLIANAAFAAGNLKVNMAKADANSAVIAATNIKAELFEIDVRDAYGDIIFSKKTEATADYKRKYDFSLLEDGTYYLEVKHGNEKYQKQFSIDRGDVEVISERRIVEPHFKFNDNIFKMSFLNYNDDNMGLYVYDDNELLYEKRFDPQFALHEGLDLSKLDAGDYTVVFSTGIDVYEHEITVD